jgi:hypothetical protein
VLRTVRLPSRGRPVNGFRALNGFPSCTEDRKRAICSICLKARSEQSLVPCFVLYPIESFTRTTVDPYELSVVSTMAYKATSYITRTLRRLITAKNISLSTTSISLFVDALALMLRSDNSAGPTRSLCLCRRTFPSRRHVRWHRSLTLQRPHRHYRNTQMGVYQ